MTFSIATFIHFVSFHTAAELGSAWAWVAELWDRDVNAELSHGGGAKLCRLCKLAALLKWLKCHDAQDQRVWQHGKNSAPHCPTVCQFVITNEDKTVHNGPPG